MKIEDMREIRDMAQGCLTNGENAEVLKKLFDSAENDGERMDIAVSLGYHMNNYSKVKFSSAFDLDQWILAFRMREALGISRDFGILEFSVGVVNRTYSATYVQKERSFSKYLSEAASIFEWMADYIRDTPEYDDNWKESDYRLLVDACRDGKMSRANCGASYKIGTFRKLLTENPENESYAKLLMFNIEREIKEISKELEELHAIGQICFAYEVLALLTRRMILGGFGKDELFSVMETMNSRVNEIGGSTADGETSEDFVKFAIPMVENMRYTLPMYENIAYIAFYIAAFAFEYDGERYNDVALKLLQEDFSPDYMGKRATDYKEAS